MPLVNTEHKKSLHKVSENQINNIKMWSISPMEYNLAMKRNEALTQGVTLMDLGNTMPN